VALSPAFLLLFLSWMMVSKVKYPSFKSLDFRARRTFFTTLIAILFLGSVVVSKGKVLIFVLPLFFTAYLIYGFIRPRIPRRIRHESKTRRKTDGRNRLSRCWNCRPFSSLG